MASIRLSGRKKRFAIGKQIGYKYLDSVVQRYACRDDEKQDGLPFGQRFVLLHLLSTEHRSQNKHEHRHHEMVGNDGCHLLRMQKKM